MVVGNFENLRIRERKYEQLRRTHVLFFNSYIFLKRNSKTQDAFYTAVY